MCGEGRALPKEIVFYLDYRLADEDAMEEQNSPFQAQKLISK